MAGSKLAGGKELLGTVQNDRLFLQVERNRNKEVIKGKKQIGHCKVSFLRGWQGLIKQITYLVLIN